MTKIDPITSEEVLARQVKENELAAAEKLKTTANDNNSSVGVGENVNSSQTRNLDQPLPPRGIKQASAGEIVKQEGFYYRLPLMSYVLGLIYLQIAGIVLYGKVLAVLTYISYRSTSTAVKSETLWELIIDGTEIWVLIGAACAMGIFLLSGSRILRFIAIVGALAGLIFLGVQMANYIAKVMQYSQQSEVSILPFASSPVITGILFGATLMIVTVLHLLGRKASVAYK